LLPINFNNENNFKNETQYYKKSYTYQDKAHQKTGADSQDLERKQHNQTFFTHSNRILVNTLGINNVVNRQLFKIEKTLNTFKISLQKTK
jgi:hypothetical protein